FLLRAGLVIERETYDNKNEYLKIFAPFSLLCENAQSMKLKFPLKVHRIINVASYSDLKSYVNNEIFKNKYELSKLISDKVFTGYYPLHDKSKKSLDISFHDKSKENLDEPFHDKLKENFDKPLHDKSKENLNKDLTENTRIFWRKV
ncbi:11507_t:CDS:2, partial [Racocetra persica]